MEVWQHIACGEHTHLLTILEKNIWLAYITSRERNLGLKVYSAQQTLFKLIFFPREEHIKSSENGWDKTHKRGREKSQTAGDEIDLFISVIITMENAIFVAPLKPSQVLWR